MAKPFMKKKSKRVSTRKRCKVEKKVREHVRKQRKESKKIAKKTGGRGRKPLITVPNKCPFKEDILKEALKLKQEAEEAAQKRKERIKEQKKAKKTVANVLSDALEKQKKFEAAHSNVKSDGTQDAIVKDSESSFKSYFSEVKKVIETADVVIEVLDARDPLAGRCTQVEQLVVSSGKRLVLLLNKIDLVPRNNVEQWIKYLRSEFPTVPFKSSTQEQRSNLGSAPHQVLYATSKCVGADLLMKLLGNYCRNKDVRTLIRVGIIGFPNVGKSSVINSLKRAKACNAGALPGITKCAQEVELDKKIRLIDSPGVVMTTKSEAVDASEVALRNCIKVESISDPVTPIHAVLRRCSRENLMLQYNLPDFNDVNEFLCLLAKKLGRLKKGGVPDFKAAARKVLVDWNSGKIRYYTLPPANENVSSPIESTLLSELSKEFDLNAIDNEQKLLFEDLPESVDTCSFLVTSTSNASDLMETEDRTDSNFVLEPMTTSSHADVEMADVGNRLPEGQQLNKAIKKRFKAEKKKRKRIDNLAENLFSTLDMTE